MGVQRKKSFPRKKDLTKRPLRRKVTRKPINENGRKGTGGTGPRKSI